MASVRSKNTLPEIMLRESLFGLGMRYRLHKKSLPGSPDIVFGKAKVAIFCDGDFWHGRNWIERKKKGQFKTRRKFWIKKIEANIKRDRLVDTKLHDLDWLVLRFWETDIYAHCDGIGIAIAAVVKAREKISISSQRADP